MLELDSLTYQLELVTCTQKELTGTSGFFLKYETAITIENETKNQKLNNADDIALNRLGTSPCSFGDVPIMKPKSTIQTKISQRILP